MSADSVIERVAQALREVDGIIAVVLGGSRARGNFHDKSDIDMGIYYDDAEKLDLRKLTQIAAQLDDEHREGLVTQIGEWGPWINGGGWLVVEGFHTDFLLRDLNKVETVMRDGLSGRITMDYQPGHPFGFVNAIYLAELHHCRILWSSSEAVQRLKKQLIPYPAALKKGMIQKFLWEAGFSLSIAVHSFGKNDVSYLAGSFYRTVCCLVQVLYAINETFVMNEKGAIPAMGAFKLIPCDFAARVDRIFRNLSTDREGMQPFILELEKLVHEVEALCQR